MKSSHFCKLAVTASLVMGIVSGAQAAGSNTAKVTFLGNIVDSPAPSHWIRKIKQSIWVQVSVMAR